MAHGLVFVLMPAGSEGAHPGDLFHAVLEVIDRYDGRGMELDRGLYLLTSEDEEPDDIDDLTVTWRMSHRQARLELGSRYWDAGRPLPTAETPLEEIAEFARQTAEYHRETYVVDGDDIVGTSALHPFQHFDSWDIGGVWTDDFAVPARHERPDIRVDCDTCKGKGEIPPKAYLLPRFLRLTAVARQDPGVPTPCKRCSGVGHFVTKPTIDSAPDATLVKTPEEAISLMDNGSLESVGAIIDLEGRWHGGGAGGGGSVAEDQGDDADARQTEICRTILRAAPHGTIVVPIDIHI